MYILVLGNPVDGFKFEGLFTTTQDAVEYGERNHPHVEWWTAYLTLNKEYMHADYDPRVGVGADEPTTVIKVVEDTCSCGHSWNQHQQNVHGIYVCTQCNCRGMQPPSELPKSAANDF